jgi:energy-coupling factor transporter ATP-binding protein EcfA2
MDPITLTMLARPAAKIADRLLKPLYTKIEKEISIQAQLAWHKLYGSYTNYLEQTVTRHSYFTSVVFKNEQRRLADYYLPLTLIQTREKDEIVVDKYPTEEIAEVKRMLIVDTAGMGKTTLLKHMFIQCVEEEAGIPIFIELRKLSKKTKLIDFIKIQLADVEGKWNTELFYKLLSLGNFVFFLDGYDEVPESERAAVSASIQSFIEKSPENKFFMSSRDEAGLVAFSHFQRYTIRPLLKEEAFTLLRKYANFGHIAETLIKKLEQPENEPIHEFLTNPLLTSLLFKSFEYKHVIPLKRHIFYSQVYEALYDAHDLTKEGGEFIRLKKSGLDIDRLANILRAFGAITYKASATEFTREAALKYLDGARKSAVEPKISSSDLLQDLTHAVPLLVLDGNYIRWSHRSIQEYFAAQFICRKTDGSREKILLDHYEKDDYTNHLNLILLCADMDRFLFDQSIGVKLAEDLLDIYSKLFLVPTSIQVDLINERKAYMAGKHIFFLRIDAKVDFEEHLTNFTKAIHQRIRKTCSDPSVKGTALHFGDPGHGFGITRIDFFVSECIQRIELPFITHIPDNYTDKWKVDISDEIDFLQVTDEPLSLLNSENNFALTNEFLSKASKWKFDPKAAEQYISDIRAEISDRASVEPW